jgi:hypothetical protein
MARLLAALLLLLVLPAPASAGPIALCPVATLSVYLQLTDGCLVETYLFTNFATNLAQPDLMTLSPLVGESPGLQISDGRQTDAIEVLSFSWGATQGAAGGQSLGADTDRGGASVSEISIVRTINAATIKLLEACAKALVQPPSIFCGGHPPLDKVTFPFAATSGDITLTMRLDAASLGGFGTGRYTVKLQPVPEPSAMWLMVASCALFAYRCRRKHSVYSTTPRRRVALRGLSLEEAEKRLPHRLGTRCFNSSCQFSTT